MEITRRSRLTDVLRAYPFLEEQIIDIAPPFKNLRNPVLRRTVGQLATVESVAQIGNMDVVDLVNTLRRLAGQGELAAAPGPLTAPALEAGAPAWIVDEPSYVVNGTELLDAGEVPLERVNELLAGLPPNGYILLVTNFEPAPIVEAMQKQRRPVHHRVESAEGRHFTYIGK